MKTTTAIAIGLGTYLVGLAVGYQTLVRDRCLHWGATPEEISRTMFGDELQPDPDIVATRAVTVDADPAAIWPWLVQMGPGRGGAYTYDWIENLLGLDMHSAEEILPQFQDLAIGDTLTLGPNGPTMYVVTLDPERALVFASTDGNWIWSFGLYPSDGSTRLVSRNTIATPDATAPKRLFNRFIMEPGSWGHGTKDAAGHQTTRRRPRRRRIRPRTEPHLSPPERPSP